MTIFEEPHATEVPHEIEESHTTVLQSRSGFSIENTYQTEIQLLSNSIDDIDAGKKMIQEQQYSHCKQIDE